MTNNPSEVYPISDDKYLCKKLMRLSFETLNDEVPVTVPESIEDIPQKSIRGFEIAKLDSGHWVDKFMLKTILKVIKPTMAFYDGINTYRPIHFINEDGREAFLLPVRHV